MWVKFWYYPYSCLSASLSFDNTKIWNTVTICTDFPGKFHNQIFFSTYYLHKPLRPIRKIRILTKKQLIQNTFSLHLLNCPQMFNNQMSIYSLEVALSGASKSIIMTYQGVRKGKGQDLIEGYCWDSFSYKDNLDLGIKIQERFLFSYPL